MARDRDNGMWTDSLAEKEGEDLDETWLQGKKESLEKPIMQLVTECLGKKGKRSAIFQGPVTGGYNAVWMLFIEDHPSVCFRVPLPSVSFPEEKTRAEVATLRYVAENTTIPVPQVYHWGIAEENPTGLGPFIIMEFISHTQTLASVLRANENRVKEDEPTLNTSLPIETVEHCYRQMANICLQLSELEMPRIGSLSERSNGSIEVATRPLSQSVNDLPHSAGCPREILPPVDQTYSSSYDWYCHLADKLVAQLVFQHNDAVESGDDCRDKFVARYLFRRLIRDRATSQTASASSESETFKFWCDDIRPNSVLLDNDLKVVGVIDGEWSYFVPASFASDPPWWLLLAKPEYDSDGFDSWVERYPAQLEIFLKMLEEEEKEPAQPKKASITEKLAKVNLQDSDTRPLSVRMRESWETGDFWINYAARKPYAFDPAFWKQIDVRFFGPNERGGYENRLSLLPEKVRRRMEWLAKQKMKEKEEYCLVEWKSGTATAYLRALLSAMD